MRFIPNLIIFASFIFIFGTFTGCITTKKSSIDLTQQTSLSDDQMFEFKYQFFKANQYFLEDKLDLSLSLFNSCLKLDPQSSATHYKMASIFLKQKELNLAEKHAELAVLYNSNNVWYLYLLGSIYSMNNKTAQAKEVFYKLIDLKPDEMEFYFHLADVYLKEGDYNGTIKVSNLIESKFGVSESISLQKNKLYIAQNKNKDALKELTNLSGAYPNRIQYKRYIADFYFQTNSIDEAIETYNNILNDYPNDGFSYIGLADCYRKKGNYDETFRNIKLAFQSDELPSEVKFNILISLLQNAEKDSNIQKDTYELAEILFNQYPDNPDIVTIYANFKLQHNELDVARELLSIVIISRKDKYAVWEQLILLDNEFSDWESLYSHSKEALTYFPNQSFLYFFKGFGAFQLKDYGSAVNSFSFGLKIITSNDPMKLDFLAYLGESYYQDSNKNDAYKTFDKLLELDPQNIMVLNNYAYYLSLDNFELDKAESMSQVTIIKEPLNATYLDTYAWILFKQNKHTEALVYIQKAIDNDSNASDVVLEHYGDILFMNNRIDDAIIQWVKARKLGEGSGLLDKKIDEKTYFE